MVLDPNDYDYSLPSQLIANTPSRKRDNCRLLILDRSSNRITHHKFSDIIKYLGKNDVLVLNQSKVFPARVYGKKITGGKVELLLLNSSDGFTWETLFKPGQKVGTRIIFTDELTGQVVDQNHLRFNLPQDKVFHVLDRIGITPTPPYINTVSPESVVRKQYQTVYAKDVGSAAAPTAGLHFTKALLHRLHQSGVQIEYVTLHVGLGTFQPLRPENLTSKTLHHEFYSISPDTASRLNDAKKQGKRIVAVGTTAVRTLESAVDTTGNLTKLSGLTNIFIYPSVAIKFVDSLITNFHLPKSSLLMLVTAFTGSPSFPNSILKQAYLQAIEKKYRFFSFGDAMLIV